MIFWNFEKNICCCVLCGVGRAALPCSGAVVLDLLYRAKGGEASNAENVASVDNRPYRERFSVVFAIICRQFTLPPMSRKQGQPASCETCTLVTYSGLQVDTASGVLDQEQLPVNGERLAPGLKE